MNNKTDNFWFGDEDSFYSLDAAMRRLLMSETPVPRCSDGGLDEWGPNPVTTTVVDGVGVMSIRGGLWDKANWMTRWIGIATYEDIQLSLAAAAEDSDIKVVLQNWDSPGGMAKGCKKCADFTRKFAETVKPVYSFTEGLAASAALWNYSAALGHFADPEAELGSIGVIMVHSEYTEMDKQLGITRKVFRSAPYKALGGPYEKLTEEGEKEIQDSLDRLHEQFATSVAELSGIPQTRMDKKIATGKVFLAKEAQELGLVDKLLSIDEVVRKLARGAKPRK